MQKDSISHRNHISPDLPDEAIGDAAINDIGIRVTDSSVCPHCALCAHSSAIDDLARSERRYRRLFEAAQDGILLLDVNTGRITDANPYMYELLGYLPDALLGKELWELGLFKDREASQAAFHHLHEVGYIRYEDLPLETLGGEKREVEFVSNVYRENGHVVIQCNIRDITQRKAIERDLHAALARELRITEALQYPLMVDIAEDTFPGLRIAACYEPALKEAEVGGDFFDAFSFQSKRKTKGKNTNLIALAVGDVMGKGILAAAFAGRVKDVMRAFLQENHDPAYTLTRLNDYLCNAVSSVGYSDEYTRKITVLALSLMVINPRTGTAAIASAGSEPPAVIRASGAIEVIPTQNMLLGVQPGIFYRVHRLHLGVEDILLMATDGITEARRAERTEEQVMNHELGLLGYEEMLAIALRNLDTTSLRTMSQKILKEARDFGPGFRDDVCLLLASRR